MSRRKKKKPLKKHGLNPSEPGYTQTTAKSPPIPIKIPVVIENLDKPQIAIDAVAEQMPNFEWDFIIYTDGSAENVEGVADYHSVAGCTYVISNNPITILDMAILATHGDSYTAEMYALLPGLLHLDKIVKTTQIKPKVVIISDCKAIVDKANNKQLRRKACGPLWALLDYAELKLDIIYTFMPRCSLGGMRVCDSLAWIHRQVMEVISKQKIIKGYSRMAFNYQSPD